MKLSWVISALSLVFCNRTRKHVSMNCIDVPLSYGQWTCLDWSKCSNRDDYRKWTRRPRQGVCLITFFVGKMHSEMSKIAFINDNTLNLNINLTDLIWIKSNQIKSKHYLFPQMCTHYCQRALLSWYCQKLRCFGTLTQVMFEPDDDLNPLFLTHFSQWNQRSRKQKKNHKNWKTL